MNAMEVAEVAGITYRQCDVWTRNGLLRPMGGVTPGTGHSRRYPPGEVAVAVTIGRLVHAGVTVQVAARIARGDEKARLLLRQALQRNALRAGEVSQ